MTVEADSGSADGKGNLSLFFDTSGPGGPQQGSLPRSRTTSIAKARFPLTANINTIGITYVVVPVGPGNNTAGKVVVLTANSTPSTNDWGQ